MTLLLDAYLALKPPNTARAYRPAIAGWLAWLGKEPARATQRDAAAYDRDTESANRLLRSPKGKAAMTEFSAALGALTAR